MAKTNKEKLFQPLTSIKVVGVGGGGGNAVSRMSTDFARGVEFIAINTDQQDLDHCQARRKIHIGRNLTRGLGTGMNPEVGRQAAEENRSEIAEALRGADIVFISAGLGGGTGSGASPVIAEVAKQLGALTVAVVTKPFAFEGVQREKIAGEAALKLKDKVDALIIIPNDRIFSIISKDTPIMKAFSAIDEILKNALRGVVDLIVTPGIINVDFADVRTVMADSGSAIVGIGTGTGPERAITAVTQALNSPLLEVSAEGARGVLLGISGGRDLKMAEINEAAKLVAQTVSPDARIIFGAYYDKNLREGGIKITVIATGFTGNPSSQSLFSQPKAVATEPVFSPLQPKNNPPVSQQQNNPAMNSPREGTEDTLRRVARDIESTSIIEQRGPARSSDPDSKKKEKDNDIWDIPTFLRRKK
jgi:cell division protein FtsZ